MARVSYTWVIISAVIGAIIGSLASYQVLGGTLDSAIDARLAASGQAMESVGVDLKQSDSAGGSGGNPSGTASQSALEGLDTVEQTVTGVYREVSPSVVHVSTVQYMRNMFFQIEPQEGTGSGFIISQDGYVLTNNHVIAGAQDITVRLSDGQEYDAELVGTDQMTDLAVLHMTGAQISADWVATLGDSDTLQVGQRAIAIGNPFGLDSTVTVGVISALDRPVSTEDTTFESMIQTDASINPGNSGGPLIDSAGEVIGINTVILSRSGGSQGIGFAIPINSAKKVSNDLIQYGRVRRPSVGFTGVTLYPDLARELGLDASYGILVQQVDPNSAAARAGLRGGTHRVVLYNMFGQAFPFLSDGDIILSLNGEKVSDVRVLTDSIQRMELDSQAVLGVYRDGQEIELTITLSE